MGNGMTLHLWKPSILLLTFLSGCTQPEDIYRLEPVSLRPSLLDRIDEPDERITGVAVDAKQRFVWGPNITSREIIGVDDRGLVKFGVGQRQVLCAEPSPDAMSTFSASVVAAARAEASARGASGALSGEFSQSISEAARVLGQRTATLQLLRDAFYRACEAYSNGLIDSFGYALILNKVDELMVELVAIEALGQGQLKPDDQTRVGQAAEAEAKQEVDAAALEQARQADREAQADLRSRQAGERSAATLLAQLKAAQAASDAIVATGRKATESLGAARTNSTTLAGQLATKNAEIAEQDRIIATEGTPAADPGAIAAARSRKSTLLGEKAELDQRKLAAEANIARLEQQEAQGADEEATSRALASEVASAQAAIDAAKGERTSAEGLATAARTALTTAESTAARSAADAEGKRAVLGTIRPDLDAAAMNQIAQIVELAESDSGALTGACAIWFAQHPQIMVQPGTDPPQLEGTVPAIAHLCFTAVLQRAASAPSNTPKDLLRPSLASDAN